MVVHDDGGVEIEGDADGLPRVLWNHDPKRFTLTLDGDEEDELYLSDLYCEITAIRYFVRLGGVGRAPARGDRSALHPGLRAGGGADAGQRDECPGRDHVARKLRIWLPDHPGLSEMIDSLRQMQRPSGNIGRWQWPVLLCS